MASKKQQSRVAKAKRHGLGRHMFQYVQVDEEGNEIEVEKAEKPARAAAKGSSAKGGARPRRQAKAPQPPSVKRLAKRGALFLPLILILTLTQKKTSTDAKIFQAVLFMVVFVAMMWLSDHLVYKMWAKKQPKAPEKGGRPGAGGPGKG